jgi:hypothetical protein
MESSGGEHATTDRACSKASCSVRFREVSNFLFLLSLLFRFPRWEHVFIPH